MQRKVRSYTPNIEAYDLYIQGRAKRIPPTPGNLTAALKLFGTAMELDPGFAGGHAGASFVHSLYAFSPKSPLPPQEHLSAALNLGEKAVELDQSFGPSHGSLAVAHFRGRNYDKAISGIRRAMELAPSDALMRALYGRFLGYNGAAKEGIEQAKQALRMSPDSRPALFILGENYRAGGQLQEAINTLEEHRKLLGGRLILAPALQLAAACSQVGRELEAAGLAGELLKKVPNLSLEFAERTNPYRRPGDMKLFVEALRSAGLPET